ncbi:MAG: hypothetical protein ACPGF7_09930 [Pontibacterium sp.]
MPIPYSVTKPSGALIFALDGRTAYKGLSRGTFDIEPMSEVKAYKLPSLLPAPTIIQAASADFYTQLNQLETKGPVLKGEDLVFKTIDEDMEKERCFVYGEACSTLEIVEED